MWSQTARILFCSGKQWPIIFLPQIKMGKKVQFMTRQKINFTVYWIMEHNNNNNNTTSNKSSFSAQIHLLFYWNYSCWVLKTGNINLPWVYFLLNLSQWVSSSIQCNRAYLARLSSNHYQNSVQSNLENKELSISEQLILF